MVNPLELYDAITLLPLERRKTLQLDSFPMNFSFWPETDIFLFACTSGNLYSYDFNKRILKKEQKLTEEFLPVATFINSYYYVFSTSSLKLCVGDLGEGSLFNLGSGNARIHFLQKLEKKHLLLSALTNGEMRIYRTDRLPRLLAICTIQHCQAGGVAAKVENVMIGRKEFIITSSQMEGTVRV